MKVAAVVILYHPEQSVIKNILSYSPFVDFIYAFDNSEKENKEFNQAISSISNCQYIKDGTNKGIAARLNQGCALAKANGYQWLLTMDQDSSFSEENISNYLNCVSSYDGKENVAQFGVQHEEAQWQNNSCITEEKAQLITSGSLVNLGLERKTGGFNEDLFIDQVDFEYCYRAIEKGYKIIQFKNVFLHHSLGSASTHTSLKSFKQTVRSLHSPIRLYYMTRNFLYVQAKYQQAFPAEIQISKKDLLNRIKNNLLYNRKKWQTLIYIVRGIADYKGKRMGRYK